VRLVTLGTGTVSPSGARTSAAYWIDGLVDGRTDGLQTVPVRQSVSPSVRLLLDCGAGACHRLARFGIDWTSVTHIAISHFHVDHLGELPALLFALKYGAAQPRTAPLTVLGPPGFREKMHRLAAAFGDWVTEPGWPLEIVELGPGTPFDLGGATLLEAFHTPHTDESFAYSIRTGVRRMVYTGDTGPSDELGDWAEGCDLLLAECSLPDHMAMAIHLTPASVGALAARARAKRLVLTHLYPPVEGVDILGAVGAVYRGPAVVARDGDAFEIAES